jgi:small subunit ribosomal protein S20
MPNIKSSIKRARQNQKRREQNRSQRSALRTSVKAVEAAVASGDAAAAKAALLTAIKKLDKAAGKGLIHKNAAARKKSRLTKKVNAIEAKAQ